MFLLAHVSFSDHLSSVVCLSVPPSLCKLFTFSSSPEPRGQFKPNLAQNILKWRGFRFVQFKVHVLFLGGDDNETSKIHWRNLKIFLRTTWPISVKLETNPFVKGIQVWRNMSFLKRWKTKHRKYIDEIVFSWTTGPFSIKLDTKHLWVKEIQVFSNKGFRFTKKKRKYNDEITKKNQNQKASYNQTWQKAFLDKWNSN